jgi:hypothetical protein
MRTALGAKRAMTCENFVSADTAAVFNFARVLFLARSTRDRLYSSWASSRDRAFVAPGAETSVHSSLLYVR